MCAYYFPVTAQKTTSLTPLVHLASSKLKAAVSAGSAYSQMKPLASTSWSLSVTRNAPLSLGLYPLLFKCAESNIGHNLFWIENKYYLIGRLGELVSRQRAVTGFGLWPRCQGRCLRFYRRVAQLRSVWGWSRAKPREQASESLGPEHTMLVTRGNPVGDTICDITWQEESVSSWESNTWDLDVQEKL